MTPSLPDILGLATRMAQLGSHPSCDASPKSRTPGPSQSRVESRKSKRAIPQKCVRQPTQNLATRIYTPPSEAPICHQQCHKISLPARAGRGQHRLDTRHSQAGVRGARAGPLGHRALPATVGTIHLSHSLGALSARRANPVGLGSDPGPQFHPSCDGAPCIYRLQ